MQFQETQHRKCVHQIRIEQINSTDSSLNFDLRKGVTQMCSNAAIYAFVENRVGEQVALYFIKIEQGL